LRFVFLPLKSFSGLFWSLDGTPGRPAGEFFSSQCSSRSLSAKRPFAVSPLTVGVWVPDLPPFEALTFRSLELWAWWLSRFICIGFSKRQSLSRSMWRNRSVEIVDTFYATFYSNIRRTNPIMKIISQFSFVVVLGVIVGAVALVTPVPANAASAQKSKQGALRLMEDAPCPAPSPSPSPGG
jgi:hypothetical protein